MLNKLVFLLILFVSLFFSCIIYYYMKTETPKELSTNKNITNKLNNINLIFDNTSIFEETDGFRIWELKAKTIFFDPITKVTKFYNIEGNIFQNNGKKIDFTAQTAYVETDKHEIIMEGNVKVIAEDGWMFCSNKVFYFSSSKHFSAVGNIIIKKNDIIITGDKMESDDYMNQINIYGNATIKHGGNIDAN